MGESVDATDVYGRTALMLACLINNEQLGDAIARLLLSRRASVLLRSSIRSSPFQSCSNCGKMSLPKRLAPYWSNPPFLIFWHSGTLAVLSARVPESKKNYKDGLDQYGAEHFGRLIFGTIRKSVGLRGLMSASVYVTTCRECSEKSRNSKRIGIILQN